MDFSIFEQNNCEILIQEILALNSVRIFVKREDQIHPQISGNKFWKLYYNLKNYLETKPENPMVISFGGAFSNHISALSFAAKELIVKSLGIIRGEELSRKIQENPTLKFAEENGMQLRFVSREVYRCKEILTENLQREFPDALIIPEGGTNEAAVMGVKMMLDERTKHFDYLCCAVGTGGTLAGISRFAEAHQKVLGFPVVKDDSLKRKIAELSGRENFEMIPADFGGYGKISDEVVNFINDFYQRTKIPLEPVYTGKMLLKIFQLAEENYFPNGSEILAFHTGGLQGISGANAFLQRKNRPQIKFCQ